MIRLSATSTQQKTTSRRAQTRQRRGGAAIELAVCLPAVVLLIMGSIEACSMMFVKQSLHIAAYEGIRRAIEADATDDIAEARCQQVLDQRSIENATIDFIPAGVDGIARGSDVMIRVTAPVRDNSLTQLRFFSNNLVAEATMVKE